MWHVGVDLSWKTSMVAMMSDEGVRVRPRRYGNRETEKILAVVTSRGPFRAVIEATGSYGWLYEILSPHGEEILAHPKRLAAIWSARAKTDKIDAANLPRAPARGHHTSGVRCAAGVPGAEGPDEGAGEARLGAHARRGSRSSRRSRAFAASASTRRSRWSRSSKT